MLYRDELIQTITALLTKSSTEDLEIFLIFLDNYLRRKR